MQQIRKWLAGSQNFIIGSAIYRALGTDQELLELLQEGDGLFVRSELLKGMQRLLEAADASTDKADIPADSHPDQRTAHKSSSLAQSPASVPEPGGGAVMASSTDTVLQAIKNEWLGPYKKMQYLVSQLDKYGTSNDLQAVTARSDLSAQILELEQQCQKIWEKRDFYLQTGELPAEKTNLITIPTDPVELATLINRTKRNIRTNRLQMQLHPDKPNFAKKYLSYKAQYQQITGKQYQEVDNE